MNDNYEFTAINLKDFKLNNSERHDILFRLLVLNTFIVLVLLISILYPLNSYKKIIVKFFSIQISISKIKLKIYHVLFLILGVYIYLYYCLKITVQQYIIKSNETYTQKLIRLDKKWVIESEIWMIFLIIICLLSIYKNAHLFNKEIKLNEKIKDINKEIINNNNNNEWKKLYKESEIIINSYIWLLIWLINILK